MEIQRKSKCNQNYDQISNTLAHKHILYDDMLNRDTLQIFLHRLSVQRASILYVHKRNTHSHV